MAAASKTKPDYRRSGSDDKMETKVEEVVDEAKLTVAGTAPTERPCAAVHGSR